jgi:hypothetical protein
MLGKTYVSGGSEARQKGVLLIPKRLTTAQAVLLPIGFAAGLVALTAFPQIGRDPTVFRSFLGAAAVLVGWALFVVASASRTSRELFIQAAIRKPHVVQMFAQGAVLAYWGWHVRAVYDWAPMILGQILFAYGVDALLQWSRRDTYHMGVGPIPVMFSINLFLWFKPEWFYFQFAMVAVGFLAKALIRWEKDGRSAHIFNPSSFPLAIASLLLILTGNTDMTWGVEIASTQYNPPNIFLVIFLASLPGQLLFGVATMTWSAVVSAYVFGLLYFSVTGVYYFNDAYIPIAVFLGMHLLFTDPSTSPKSESGRVIFGVLYGMGCIGLVVVLGALGAPAFYDKLLPVPILNLSVRFIDRIAQTGALRNLEPARLVSWVGVSETRLATSALWVATFIGVSAAGGVGDNHPGQYLPFWSQACEAGSNRGCEYLAFMEQVYCERGSVWACNELGITLASKLGDSSSARGEFQRACAMGSSTACANVVNLTGGGGAFEREPPSVEDLPIVIRGSKGAVTETSPEALYALGCERGWTELCAGPP